MGELENHSFTLSLEEDVIALRLELGHLLVRAKLITAEQMNDALKRRAGKGGRFGDHLVAAGHITQAALDAFIYKTPVEPASIEATGIDESELAADARTLVMRVMAALGVDGRVDVVEDDAAIVITCTGDDVALLIGRHGQTIDALQYLLNAISHRAYGDDRKEVVVDSAGYRERRRATLEALAERTAEQVRVSGSKVELEPMTAVERKVVHLKLKELGGVATASEGTEPNRYIVVLPAD